MLAAGSEVNFGPGVTNLLTQVVRLGAADDPSLRLQAVAAAGALRTEASRTIPFLIARLDDAEVTVRAAAASALGDLGPAAASATNRLVAMMNSGSAPERAAAASAVWEITRDTTQTLPALRALLGEDEARSSAALVLGRMDRRAETAAPALLAALAQERTHRPSRTPSMVAVALGKVGPAAVPGLIELTGHAQADVRINAAFALRGQGTNAVTAVPALQRMLRAEDPEERLTAASTLAALGPAARAAEAELRRLADETSSDVIVGHVASAARDALRRIREGSPP
jgi:HEAT repeat protein